MKSRRIRRLLIANRGEIAVRIIRACKEVGIRSIAVYSDDDRKSLHVLSADEAYRLGGSSPIESYLNQQRIVELAKAWSADAIHPGYGFLAENAEFADLVEQSGLTFVGPAASSIRLMGDKTQARKLARELGIPTIEGTIEPLRSLEEGVKISEVIGYPVLLKAAGGGGGKGMRIVRSLGEFDSAFKMARSEAKSAFGDDRIYVEKYLDSPRHIEMQILADSHGNVVCLGERECSIQRRHQKIIEESPSTALDEHLRSKLTDAALTLAREARYSNAGTMEFLLSSEGKFYFLEMNTRLQVEHPVTEETTGLDIVNEQIKVAEGGSLRFHQHQIRPRGHAIECRICAEDPQSGFMPSTGTLTRYQLPQGRIRVENGFREGDEISVHYDSLLAKVISWRPTRDEAISALGRALDEFKVQGVSTTIAICRSILNHAAFVEGNIDTHFIDKHFQHLTSYQTETADARIAAIAGVLLHSLRRNFATSQVRNLNDTGSRWKWSRRDTY